MLLIFICVPFFYSSIDASEALAMEGVAGFMSAKDIAALGGVNDCGKSTHAHIYSVYFELNSLPTLTLFKN